MALMEENNNKYEGLGLTGLANLGNTCFMNSALQCLSHTYEFNDFLDRETFKNFKAKNVNALALYEWNELRKLMWSENCIIQPIKFVTKIQLIAKKKDNHNFVGWNQNDLEEFLTFLFDCFHDAIKRDVEMTISGDIDNTQDRMAETCYKMMKQMYRKEWSEIIKLFYGIHVSTVTNNTDYTSHSPEPISIIKLSIPKRRGNTIYDCFNNYIKSEQIDDIITNEKNNIRETCEKSIKFWELPDILICSLKRFYNNGRKNQVLVTFPLTELDLSTYVVGYDSKKHVYDLYGICNHSGGTMGGHYTAYVKTANNNWYEFNDTNVTKITNLSKLVSPYAYCLFYRKKKYN